MDDQHLTYRLVDAVTEGQLTAQQAVDALDELTFRDDYPYRVDSLVLAKALRDRYPSDRPVAIRDAIEALLDDALESVEDLAEDLGEPETGDTIFNRDKVERAAGLLLVAFTWSETTQGHGYWHDAYKALCNLAGTTTPAATGAKRNDPATIRELHGLIATSFTWTATEQGQDFWGAREDALLELARTFEGAEHYRDDARYDAEKVKEAIARIRGSFAWVKTEQGFPYWNQVVKDLVEIAGISDRHGAGVRSDRTAEGVDKIRELIRTSFTWHRTPQGHSRWAEVYENLRTVGRRPFGPKSPAEKASELRSMLRSAFYWGGDERGDAYWRGVDEGLARIAGEEVREPEYYDWEDALDEKERRERIATKLWGAFTWSKTEEGHAHWYDVAAALEE